MEHRAAITHYLRGMEKQAMDPLSMLGMSVGLHLTANAAAKGLRVAHSAGIPVLGKMLPGIESRAVAGGIHRGIANQPPPLRHSVINTWAGPEYLANAPVGKELGVGLRSLPRNRQANALKSLSRELGRIPGVEHTPVLGALRDGTSRAANKSLSGGLPKAAPPNAQDAPSSIVSTVAPLAVGAALSTVTPDALIHGGINYGRMALAKSSEGAKFFSDQIREGVAEAHNPVAKTLKEKVKNLAIDFGLSPAARDAGVAAKKLTEFSIQEPRKAARLANSLINAGLADHPLVKGWLGDKGIPSRSNIYRASAAVERLPAADTPRTVSMKEAVTATNTLPVVSNLREPVRAIRDNPAFSRFLLELAEMQRKQAPFIRTNNGGDFVEAARRFVGQHAPGAAAPSNPPRQQQGLDGQQWFDGDYQFFRK